MIIRFLHRMCPMCLVLIFTLTVSSCVKPSVFPVEPYVEFRSFEIKGDSLYIKFYFQDGDGNIGLKTGDTLAPFVGEYHYNLYFIPYQKTANNTYDSLRPLGEIPKPAIIYKYRIPYIEPVNANKALKGEMRCLINDASLIHLYQGKTIRFEGYLYDRTLHRSNTLLTSDMVLDAKNPRL